MARFGAIFASAGTLGSGKVLLSAGADPNTGDMARGIPSALALARRGGAIFRPVCRYHHEHLISSGTNPALRGLIEEHTAALNRICDTAKDWGDPDST